LSWREFLRAQASAIVVTDYWCSTSTSTTTTMHVRTADVGSTLQMASSAESARARSDVARGWADYFVSTHARRAWLLHEYLHPTRASRATRLLNLMPLRQVGIGARSSTRQ
jgi:hypothetical protein